MSVGKRVAGGKTDQHMRYSVEAPEGGGIPEMHALRIFELPHGIGMVIIFLQEVRRSVQRLRTMQFQQDQRTLAGK